MPESKRCENCGYLMIEKWVTRKGYQGQDFNRLEWEKHELSDCIKYLRALIDDIGSRRIV